MIEVTVFINNGYTGFQAKGHAGFAEEPYDIVCAGCSALIINTVNSIERFCEDEIEANNDQDVLEVKLKAPCSDKAALLIDSMIAGLNDIKERYPDNLEIIKQGR